MTILNSVSDTDLDRLFQNCCSYHNFDYSKSKLIMSGIVGSVLYGTNNEDSDLDIKGIFAPPKKYFFSLYENVEQLQYNTNDVESEFYDFRKFLKVASKSNPTFLELLFIPEGKVIQSSLIYDEIVSNKELFISKEITDSFIGYATSQLNRIKTHRNYLLNPPKRKPIRSDYGLPEDKSYISKTKIGAFNKYLSIFLNKIKEFHELKSQIDELNEKYNFEAIVQKCQIGEVDNKTISELMPHVDSKILDIIRREFKYKQALDEWNKYQSWKNSRNYRRKELEKNYGYDVKHAMHLVRLLDECQELLECGKIIFPRKEVGNLNKIIDGKWSFDYLLKYSKDKKLELNELTKKLRLQKKPNYKKIDELYFSICEELCCGGIVKY